MACQIRRRTISAIVGLRPDKTPLQSIEAAIDLSSITQTEYFGALAARPTMSPSVPVCKEPLHLSSARAPDVRFQG
jgi:hypothetical protein